MAFEDIIYAADGAVGVITLNRPQYRNAQGYRMLDEIDAAFDLARDDEAVRVVLVRGAGGVFSTGHDLGTPEGIEYRRALGAKPGIQTYDQFKKYNLDLLLKWRNFPKPTIAMVEGYCIYAGWMLAAAMDVIFASETAEFLGGFVEYNTIPWDIGIRRAKELVFESRFISADEAARYGLVNRVLAPAELEREAFAWARRVAENSPGRAAHGQDPDEQGPGRAGLHQRGRGQPGRLPGDDAHARPADAAGRRAPPRHGRSGRQGPAQGTLRAELRRPAAASGRPVAPLGGVAR